MMLRTLAAAGVAMLALTGCSGDGGGPDDMPSATPASNQQAALELARCMRANGHPAFPDPVPDDQGRWNFPTDTIGDWVPAEACRPLVPAWKNAFADTKARTPEEMAKLRDYARCMREHGLEDFPDPDEQGNLELPERLRVMADNEDPAFAAAYDACRQLLPPQPAKDEK